MLNELNFVALDDDKSFGFKKGSRIHYAMLDRGLCFRAAWIWSQYLTRIADKST